MATATAAKERPIIFSGPMIRAIMAGAKTQTRRVVKVPGSGLSPAAKFCRRGVAYPDLFAWCDGTSDDIETWGMVGDPFRCPYGQPGDLLWCKETWRTHEDPETLIDGILFRADGAFREIENTREAADRWLAAAHVIGPRRPYRRGESLRLAPKHKGWRSASHMPRWASRLTLRVESVRVERLQEISEADADAEGMERVVGPNDKIGCFWHGPGYWDGHSKHSIHGLCRTYHARRADSGPCECYVGQAEGLTPARCAFRHLWDTINGKRPGCSWADSPWVWVVGFSRVEAG